MQTSLMKNEDSIKIVLKTFLVTSDNRVVVPLTQPQFILQEHLKTVLHHSCEDENCEDDFDELLANIKNLHTQNEDEHFKPQDNLLKQSVCAVSVNVMEFEDLDQEEDQLFCLCACLSHITIIN